MIYLSVEGDHTERNYFEHLNTCMENTLVRIEVLRHKRGDGYSDPEDVIELLTEYVQVRNGELIPDECITELLSKHTSEELQLYLDDRDKLAKDKQSRIREDLLLAGIDLDYRKYLRSIEPNTDDVFAVIIDRDCGSHSKELMELCWEKCASYGFCCYITNPCFEFWLLLHLRDVKTDYSPEQLIEFLENKKVSKQHTYTSKEVSELAQHSKTISFDKFRTVYFPKINYAMLNAKKLACNYPDILDHLGTNLPQFFEQIYLGS